MFLVLAFPAYLARKTFSIDDPNNGKYVEYEKALPCPHTEVVQEVVKRILQTEMQSGSGYYKEKIRRMIQQLPDEKNVETWIATRLSFVTNDQELSIRSTGTDVDASTKRGKYFIIIPTTNRITQEALPWSVTREVCHILQKKELNISINRVINAAVGALILNLLNVASLTSDNLQPIGKQLLAVVITVAANILHHNFLQVQAEEIADEFANQRCSKQDLKKAIPYLKQMEEKSRRKRGICVRLTKIFFSLFSFSNKKRIANIRQKIAAL